MTHITSIVYKPHDATEPATAYLRVPLETATLISGYGIEGDRKGGNPQRSLNIMSQEALAELSERGFQTAPGQLGEQLIIGGLDMNSLPAGTQLQLGESAVIEVVQPRNGCERFERYQGHPREAAAGKLGIMAQVITGGSIRVGDSVQVL